MNGPNDKVVLALVGAGGRGSQLILNMKRCTTNVEVKYICDADTGRGGRVVDELNKMQGYAPKKVANIRTVLDDKDVDGVVIATPDFYHALQTVWACRAGKDVYVEKTTCSTIDEGRAMVKAAEEYKRIVQCGYQNRSAEYSFAARDYIAAGELGNIVTVKVYCMLPGEREWVMKEDTPVPEGLDWDAWCGPSELVPYNVSRHKGWLDFWAYSPGAHMDDASHAVDLARMALGNPPIPRTVYCAGGRVLFNDKREIPDNQTILYDMGEYPFMLESSQYGNYLYKTAQEIRFSDSFPKWDTNATRIEIYGTKGFMYLGRHGGGWQAFGADMKLLSEKAGRFPDDVHHRNFIECIRSRKTPNATVEQGFYSSAMINLANLSYRTGKKMLGFDAATWAIVGNPEAAALDRKTYRKGYELM